MILKCKCIVCSFGNGQFACLILCLTMTDLLTTLCGVMGGLILEVGDMSWAGSSQGCAAYYFISSWVVGLSNYLVVCLVCLLREPVAKETPFQNIYLLAVEWILEIDPKTEHFGAN